MKTPRLNVLRVAPDAKRQTYMGYHYVHSRSLQKLPIGIGASPLAAWNAAAKYVKGMGK